MPEAGVRCAQCGVAQADAARDYYPLWFADAAGRPLCPNCVSGQVVTPTLSLINAQAVRPMAPISIDRQLAPDAAWPSDPAPAH
jgi:hypothetical protein